MQIFHRLESEARSYCRRYPAIFAKARDSMLFDVDGNTYIDFLSSAGAVNYGHNNPILKRAIVDYLQEEGPITTLDFHTVAKRAFIELFEANILKKRDLTFKLQFTSPTGTSVVESAVKLARKYTGRSNVVAFTNGFHGMSGTSLSLTGSRHHRQQFMMPMVTRLPYDRYLGDNIDTIGYFRKLLTDNSSGLDLPAAVIVESIQAEGGINVASDQWLGELRELTEAFEIVLIVDDIQVGCGRTGRFFSFERAGIVPDMVCLSKSLSGLGLPLSVLLLKPEFDVWKPGEDSGTFRGNNLAFVSAAAALQHYWSDASLQNLVAEKGATVAERLSRLARDHSARIRATRGRGLIQGIEFIRAEDANAVADRCFEQRLIIETCGPEDQVLKLLPPLTVPDATLQEGLAIVADAIAGCEGSIAKARPQRSLHPQVPGAPHVLPAL